MLRDAEVAHGSTEDDAETEKVSRHCRHRAVRLEIVDHVTYHHRNHRHTAYLHKDKEAVTGFIIYLHLDL